MAMNLIQQAMHEYDEKLQQVTNAFEQSIAQLDQELQTRLTEIFGESNGVPLEQKPRVRAGGDPNWITMSRDKMELIESQLERLDAILEKYPNLKE